MRTISESRAIDELDSIRGKLRSAVEAYERKAKSCATCETKGACCLDRHFVNVRITKLEARAIRKAIEGLDPDRRDGVLSRIAKAAETLNLREANEDTFYACPLFEKDSGCLVHNDAKPFACIVHACYERREDLPPDALLQNAETALARLEVRTYRAVSVPKSIPLALDPAAA